MDVYKFGSLANTERLMNSINDEDIDSAIDRLAKAYADIAAEGVKGEVCRVRRVTH